MPRPPRLTLRTMLLLVGVVAVELWLYTALTGGLRLPPVVVGVLMGILTLSGLGLGAWRRCGVDRTLAQVGLTCPICLVIVWFAPVIGPVGALFLVALLITGAAALMHHSPTEEGDTLPLTWAWEARRALASALMGAVLTLLLSVGVVLVGVVVVAILTGIGVLKFDLP